MISARRLSKEIQTRESKRTQDYLLNWYRNLNKKQRSVLKVMFMNIKSVKS